MYTYLKETAVTLLKGDFYSKRVLEKFFSNPKHKSARSWVISLNDVSTLNHYIDCFDVKFFGNEEKVKKNMRKYYSLNDITFNRMEKFKALNHVLLLDVYENSTNEQLKSYYKILIYLSGSDETGTYIVSQRQKLQEFFHKAQAKLINSFVTEAPSTEELRNFIIVSVLFSQCDMLHDEATRSNFVSLCKKVAD